MKPISNRYVREDFIISLDKGRLYKGKDLSLNRIIFIYAVPFQGKAYAEAYLQKIGNSAQMTNNTQFMHVFDVEMDHDTIYVIMKYMDGCPLQHLLVDHSFTYREAADFVSGIGQTLIEIAEERPLSFSISPNNIWISETGHITIINTWDTGNGKQRLSKELSGMLYRLLTRSEHVPADTQLIRGALYGSSLLHGLPDAQKKAAISIVTKAYEEQLSALSFVQSLKELPNSADTIENMQLFEAAGAAYEPEYEKEENNLFEDTRVFVYTGADSGSNRKTAAKPQLWSGISRLFKRMSVALSLGLLGIAVFIGVFAFLIENTGRKESASTAPTSNSTASASNKQQQTPAVQEKQKPEPVKTAEKPAAADNGTEGDANVPVPVLTGLTKEAAEKQALASGLRYTYYLETNHQAAGTVFKQEPMPNEQTVKGSRVTFWISKGTPAP